MSQEQHHSAVAADPQHVAADPLHSVWVSANAGTGKTRVLVDRILRLLLQGVSPNKILCLTFTRAAAAEMQNRLSGRLAEWMGMTDDALVDALDELGIARTAIGTDGALLLRARRLFAAVPESPGGIRIQTIHAFCESILSRFPIEAGIAPHARIMDERAGFALKHEAYTMLYGRLMRDPHSPDASALRYLAGQVDEKELDVIVQALFDKREEMEAVIRENNGVEGLAAAIFAMQGVSPDMSEGQLIEEALSALDVDAFRQQVIPAWLAAGTEAEKKTAHTMQDWLARDQAYQADTFVTRWTRFFFTQKQTPRTRLLTKAVCQHYPDTAILMAEEQDRLQGFYETLTHWRVASTSAALMRVAYACYQFYEERKQAAALLDYTDLILKAAALLEKDGGCGWVHYKLDGGIDHMLVDEAQDTNPAQWRIIRALTQEFYSTATDEGMQRTVFVVGDDKQSIFSFQGAEPREFSRMRAYFDQHMQPTAPLQKVSLETSFRSVQVVLDAVDGVFRIPAAQAGVCQRAGTRHRAWRVGDGGRVEILPLVRSDEKTESTPWQAHKEQVAGRGSEEQAAFIVAERIHTWLSQKEMLEAHNRPMRPGDILILVRRRKRFAKEIVRLLKVRAIPVAGSDRLVLRRHIAVMDLLALGRFVLLPEDDLTLACVLKGPFVRLSEEALFTLAHRRNGTLWQALTDKASSPASDDSWVQAHATLCHWLEQAQTKAPYEFFASLLYAHDGLRHIMGALGPEAADPVSEFLTLSITYEREGGVSLQGFVAWMERNDTEIKRDMEAVRDEVRVMTVHGAKGLEANVVILADTCSLPRTGSEGKILWMPPVAKNAKAPIPLWSVTGEDMNTLQSALYHDKKVRAMEEYRRLLYVAMTRARDRLYVVGWQDRRQKSDKGAPKQTWYAMIEEALTNAYDAGKAASPTSMTAPQTRPVETALPSVAATAATLPAWAETPLPAERVVPVLNPSRMAMTGTTAEASASPALPAADAPLSARTRGVLIHALLQYLPDVPAHKRNDAGRAWLAHGGDGLTENDRDAVMEAAMEMLLRDDLAPLFGPGSLAEVPIVAHIVAHIVDGKTAEGSRIMSGRIDRLVVDDDTVLIVDFKTDAQAPDTVAQVRPEYVRQMALYKQAIERLYPAHAVRCVILWVTLGIVMDVTEKAQKIAVD